MQRFLSGLAWNSLSIRAKVGLITALILALIVTATSISAIVLTSLGSQVREGIATTLEIRTLSEDLLLDVESLQRIHTRLVEDYGSLGFDPTTTALSDDYAEGTTDLLEELARLKILLLATVPPDQHATIEAEVNTFEDALVESQENFEQTFDIIAQLTDPAAGTLRALDSHGDNIDAQTTQLPNSLRGQIVLIRSLEGNLVRTGSTDDLLELRQAAQGFRVDYLATIALEGRSAGLLLELDAYLEQVNAVGTLLFQLDLADRTTQTSLNFARDTGSRLANIASDQADAQALEVQRLSAAVVRPVFWAALAQLVILTILMLAFGRSLVSSTWNLLGTTRRFEQGNLRARAQVVGRDEFSQLARSFNTLAAQLDELVGNLEVRVAERTRDLSITAQIGEAVLARSDLRELLQEVVDLIRQRFDFYHVQVFLVDEENQHADLVASTGAAGRALLARRHSLPVGSQSVIGQVTSVGQPVIASDTDTSLVHRRNELLPDTRGEMALPMRAGGQVIGALDVQSVAPNAFDQDTVAVFQIMADQLAIAVENARLHEQLENASQELGALERSMVAESWRAYQHAREPDKPLGYELHGEVILPRPEETPEPLAEAMAQGRAVRPENGEDIQLAVPIKVRGEVIGAFGFGGESLRNLTSDDIVLIEAVIDRVGVALENMRLVDQTVRRAEYEQIVNDITAKIVGSTDVNFILQTTVKELGRALRAPQTSVQLRQEDMETRDEQ